MKAVALVCLACVASACSESTPPPRTIVQTKPLATPEPAASLSSKSPQRGVINISEDIRKACGLSDSEAHFAFDSSRIENREDAVLSKLAQCFVHGPLAKSEMRLIGHADPRGDSDYNMVLGGSRADTVKTFMVLRGMPSSRVATSSRGEFDARGTDERSWAEDRRVDILAH